MPRPATTAARAGARPSRAARAPGRGGAATARAAGPGALPGRRPGPARAPRHPRRTGVLQGQARAVRAARAGTNGVLDALLRGRIWIALVAALLVGIVFFNVDLLRLNRDLARTADRSAQMKRENARLRLRLARLESATRIQRVAAGRGMVLPNPAEVRYLKARPSAARAKPPQRSPRAPRG